MGSEKGLKDKEGRNAFLYRREKKILESNR
jgi:hypothetical protein